LNLNTAFFRLKSYLSYYWRANSDHYLHSPFVFKWRSAMNNERLTVNNIVNEYRKLLRNTSEEFSYLNLENREVKTSISKRYKSTSINDKYGTILANTALYLHAQNFLELGTSLGVSTAYLANAVENIKGHTIDFNPNAVSISKELFARMKWTNTVFHCGRFEDILPTILTEKNIDICFIDGDHSYQSTINYVSQIKDFLSENAVIILDDIRWSEGMYQAWEDVSHLSDFNYTIDFGRIGLLFKNQNQSPKQHLILK
jgi:predicted O-methyltransferase YrrM